MNCIRCQESSRYLRRNLCIRCYYAVIKRNELDQYPHKRPFIPIESINEPTVRWLFLEIKIQEKTVADVARISGVAQNAIQSWKTRCNPSLFDFKCVAGALGYEIQMVAKEPENAEFPA